MSSVLCTLYTRERVAWLTALTEARMAGRNVDYNVEYRQEELSGREILDQNKIYDR